MVDLLFLAVLAYVIARAFDGGKKAVRDSHKKRVGKDGDKAGTGAQVAAWLLTALTAAFTFTSGFADEWRKQWPTAKETVRKRREVAKAAKAGKATEGGDGRAPLTEADGAKVLDRRDGAAAADSDQPDPAAAGLDTTNPGSISMAKPAGTIEVVSVDTLIIWLQDTLEFANRETDDANAAVKRIRDLEAKVENAYNAAAAAKYDRQTLNKLAGLREQLAKLRTARQDDAQNSTDAAGNSQISAQNVVVRHGGFNEAAAAAPADMAESDTYVG
jgi:hypothetical protein